MNTQSEYLSNSRKTGNLSIIESRQRAAMELLFPVRPL
jgi:hypothetical protein